MKRTLKTTLLLTVFFLCLTLTPKAYAEDSGTLLGDFLADHDIEVGVSASMDYYDKYIWRGFKLDGDSVLQPSVTFNVGGFEGGFWGSWDLESKDTLNSDEVDGWIGYNFDLGFLDEGLEFIGLSVGNTWYGFPELDAYTSELYVSLSFDVMFSPYVTWYHDYGDEAQGGADGNYFMIGGSYSYDLVPEYGVTLDIGQEVSLNNEAFIMGDGGYSLTTLGLSIPLTENSTMTPTIGYSVPFGDLEDSNDGNQDNEFYGGVSFSFSG